MGEELPDRPASPVLILLPLGAGLVGSLTTPRASAGNHAGAYIAEKPTVLDERCRGIGQDPAGALQRGRVLVKLFNDDAEADRYLDAEVENLKQAGTQGLVQGETLDEALRGSTLAGTPKRVIKLMGRFADVGVYRLIIGGGHAASVDCVP